MKNLKEKIVGCLIVIGIILYLILFYPFIISTDQYGETVCESIVGLRVGC